MVASISHIPQKLKVYVQYLNYVMYLIQILCFISVPLKSRQININQTIPEKGKN